MTISPPNASTAGSIASSEPPGGQDVVHEQDALAGGDGEAAPELAPRGAVRVLHLFGEDAPHAELAGRLEGQHDAAGRGAGDDVHRRRTVRVPMTRRPEGAQLARGGRILQDQELLQVALGVLAALEQEVAFLERAGLAEEILGPRGDRSRGSSASIVGSISVVIVGHQAIRRSPPMMRITVDTPRPWPTAPRSASAGPSR